MEWLCLCQSLRIFIVYVASSQRLVYVSAAHLVLNVVRLGEIELITCMKNVNYCWYGRQAMEHDIHALHMLRNVMQHWWELHIESAHSVDHFPLITMALPVH